MSRVLLIEPNQILAEQCSEFLARHGHQTTVAQDAQVAIMAADKQTPDVVITELLLSQHSGVEFLYEFRSYGEWLEVPVIILTRVPLNELPLTQKSAKELGVVRIFYKNDTSLTKIANVVDEIVTSPKPQV